MSIPNRKGIDPAPVLPSPQSKNFLLAKTLDRDEIDLGRLEAILSGQVEEAGWTLRRHNRRAGLLRLEITVNR